MTNHPIKFDMNRDNRLLTPVEQFLRGGTIDDRYLSEPNMPILFIGRVGLSPDDIKKINDIRQQFKEVEGMAISIAFGVEDSLNNHGLIRLAELDASTGRTKGLPKLSGVERSGRMDRRWLGKYHLTEAARGHLLEQFPSLNDEPREDKPSRR
jgi:hypothetical protein